MHDRTRPEHDIEISAEVLIPNHVSETDLSRDGVVFPSVVATHVDGQTTIFAGREVPTKVSIALNTMKTRVVDLSGLELRMSPVQVTLLRAALETSRERALSLVRLYQKVCDDRNVHPDKDDRFSLVELAKKLK